MFSAPRLGSRTKVTALPAASGEGKPPLVWREAETALPRISDIAGHCGNVEALIKPTDYRHLAAVADDWSQKSRGNYASRRPWR